MRIINAIVKEFDECAPDTMCPELRLETADGPRTFGGWDIDWHTFLTCILGALDPHVPITDRLLCPGMFCRLREDDEGRLDAVGHPSQDRWYEPEPVCEPTAEERLALIGRTLDWLFYDAGGIHRMAVEAAREYLLGMNNIAASLACPKGKPFEPARAPHKYTELVNALLRNPDGLLDELVKFKAVKL